MIGIVKYGNRWSTKGDAKAMEGELRRAAGLVRSWCLATLLPLSSWRFTSSTRRICAVRRRPSSARGGREPGASDFEPPKPDGRLRRRFATCKATTGRQPSIEASALKKDLGTAFDPAWIPSDYGASYDRLPEDNIGHPYLTVAKFSLAENASDPVRAPIWIALLTGCCRGEIRVSSASNIQGEAITRSRRQHNDPAGTACHNGSGAQTLARVCPILHFGSALENGLSQAREATGLSQGRLRGLRRSCASLLVDLGTAL